MRIASPRPHVWRQSCHVNSSRIVVAHLTERDFASARLTIPEIGAFKDYEDWLDFRTSGLFGLQAAGFSVEQIPIDLEKFTKWREATSTLPSISALDQFAGSSLSSAVQRARGRHQASRLRRTFRDKKKEPSLASWMAAIGVEAVDLWAPYSVVLQPTSWRRKIPYQQIWRGFLPWIDVAGALNFHAKMDSIA